MNKPRTLLLTIVLCACLGAFHPAAADDLEFDDPWLAFAYRMVQGLEGPQQKLREYLKVAESCALLGDRENAEKICDLAFDLASQDGNYSAYVRIGHLYKLAGNKEKAKATYSKALERFFQLPTNSKPKRLAGTICSILKEGNGGVFASDIYQKVAGIAYDNQEDYFLADDLICLAQEFHASGHQPQAEKTYKTAIEAAIYKGRVSLLRQIAGDCLASGYNELGQEALLNAYRIESEDKARQCSCQRGKFDFQKLDPGNLQFFLDLIDTLQGAEGPHNHTFLSEIIGGYIRIGGKDDRIFLKALDLTRDLNNSHPKADNIGKLIAKDYAKIGGTNPAIYREMIEITDGMTLADAKPECYYAIIKAYDAVGGKDESIRAKALHSMLKLKKVNRHGVYAFDGVVSLYAQRGQYDKCWQIINAMDKCCRQGSLGNLALIYAQSGGKDPAFFSRVIDETSSLEGPLNKSKAFAMIGEAYSVAGDTISTRLFLDRAIAEAANIEKPSRRTNELRKIGKQCFKAGRPELGDVSFILALKAANGINDRIYPFGQVKQTCSEYRELGGSDEGFYKEMILIADGATLEEIKGLGYQLVVHEYVLNKNFEKALAIAKQINNPRYRATALLDISFAFENKLSPDDLKKLLFDALDAMKEVKGSAGLFKNFFDGYHGLNINDKSIFVKALEVIEEHLGIPDFRGNYFSLIPVTETFAASDKNDYRITRKIYKLADGLENKSFSYDERAELFTKLGTAFTVNHRPREAGKFWIEAIETTATLSDPYDLRWQDGKRWELINTYQQINGDDDEIYLRFLELVYPCGTSVSASSLAQTYSEAGGGNSEVYFRIMEKIHDHCPGNGRNECLLDVALTAAKAGTKYNWKIAKLCREIQ